MAGKKIKTGPAEEPVPVKLKAVKRTIVRPLGQRRPDGQITTIPALAKGPRKDKEGNTHAGQVATYNGNNPSVRMYAIAGELAPVDDLGKAWLVEVKKIADAAKEETFLV